MKRGSFFARMYGEAGGRLPSLCYCGVPFPNKKATHCKAMGGGGAKHLTFY